jgi:hypothetical protein
LHRDNRSGNRECIIFFIPKGRKITDGRNLVFFPSNEEYHFTDIVKRNLQIANLDDRKIIKRLIEKALEISIKKSYRKKRRCMGYFFSRIRFLFTDVSAPDYTSDSR